MPLTRAQLTARLMPQEQPTTPTGTHPSSPFIQPSGRSETAPVSTLVTAPLVTAPAASARLRTAELRDSQKMSCFGMRSSSRGSGSRATTEDEELSGDEKVAKPPRAEPAAGPTVGMVGLKSIGTLLSCRPDHLDQARLQHWALNAADHPAQGCILCVFRASAA